MTVHKDVYCGSKSLSIDICPEHGTASIRFGTRTPSWLYPRRKGETTRVFAMADEILASTAAGYGRSLILRFDTANSHLKEWILANETALGFDALDPRSHRADRITVTKKYSPRR